MTENITLTQNSTDVVQIVADGLTRRDLGVIIYEGLKATGRIVPTAEQDDLMTAQFDYGANGEDDNCYIQFDGVGQDLMPDGGAVKFVRRNTEKT